LMNVTRKKNSGRSGKILKRSSGASSVETDRFSLDLLRAINEKQSINQKQTASNQTTRHRVSLEDSLRNGWRSILFLVSRLHYFD
jgi:hypothetical protein